jgi:hypothetical protein
MSEMFGPGIDQTGTWVQVSGVPPPADQVSGFRVAADLNSSEANHKRNSKKRISNIESSGGL